MRDRTFSQAPLGCVACHRKDYDNAALTSIDHVASHFDTDCQTCHNTWSYFPARFEAHEPCFVLSSGPHARSAARSATRARPAWSSPAPAARRIRPASAATRTAARGAIRNINRSWATAAPTPSATNAICAQSPSVAAAGGDLRGGAGEAGGDRGRRRRPRRVRFVTAKRLYLDRGAADGLRAGDKVTFSRDGRAAGGCTIDLVGAHDAVCRGRGALVGDVFAVPSRPVAASPPAPAPLPAPESNETVERRAAELAASPHDKVDFVPQARAAYVATGSAGIGVAVYATRPGAPQYVGETLDVALHHVPLGSSSFRFDTSFSVIRMQTTSPPRFRPGSVTEFYLWDAEISRREIDSQTVLAVGRIWPWHTPGLPILDGAQLGRRNELGTVEGGI